MELYLPRDEIVRQVRAHLGEQTNNALAAATNDQTLAAVTAASYEVMAACSWVNAERRVTVDLGAEQNVLNYPAGGTAGSIAAIAVFDGGEGAPAGEGRYYPLAQAVIPVQADQDQEAAAGGATFDAVQGRPRAYMQREQIYLWPYSDRAYKVRIDYRASAAMPTGSSVSIVDALLIIYTAASAVAMQRENKEMAGFFASKYQERLMALRAWQSMGTSFVMDPDADFGENEVRRLDSVPNWDTRPVVRP